MNGYTCKGSNSAIITFVFLPSFLQGSTLERKLVYPMRKFFPVNANIARATKLAIFTITVYVNSIVDVYLFIDWFISESVLLIPEGLNGVCRRSGLGKK